LNDFFNYRIFEQEAKKQGKTGAILFIDDFKKGFSKLENDPIAGGMLKKRNIKVHRRKVDNLLHAEIQTREILQLSEKSSAVLYDLKGNVIQRSYSDTKQKDNNSDSKSGESEKATSFKWYFAEYPSKEAPMICQEFLDLMKNFKNSIVMKYP
jgi:hypothetical protein